MGAVDDSASRDGWVSREELSDMGIDLRAGAEANKSFWVSMRAQQTSCEERACKIISHYDAARYEYQEVRAELRMATCDGTGKRVCTYTIATYVPAAFLKAVNRLALTTAFMLPVLSSSTSVVAGSPRSLILGGAEAVGTDTTLMAVPMGNIRDGIKSAV